MSTGMGDLLGRFNGLSLATADITLLSSLHGRQRRSERGIEKLELQAAIKYGRKERAHPGRDGAERWRFTHNGVMYITDATCRHEITSWRLDDAPPAPPAPYAVGSGYLSHTVIVVDRSGSMRLDDIPGYNSRTEAVYDCLAREFVKPLWGMRKGAGRAVVTLIEMGTCANVLLKRAALDEGLLAYFQRRASSRARLHGNYLPALDKVIEVLREDAAHQASRGTVPFVEIFLSCIILMIIMSLEVLTALICAHM